MDQELVIYSGSYDSYVHPAFCRQLQFGQHCFIDDQIRGIDVYIFLRVLNYMQINVFSHIFLVERAVGVGLNETVALAFGGNIRVRYC